jgi:hypothetical protein
MNVYLMLAGSMLGIMALNHNIVGARFIVNPIVAMPDIPPLLGSVSLMRRVVIFSWHLTGVGLLGYALLLLHLARSEMDSTGTAISWLTIIVNAASAILILVVSRGRHFSWPVFAAVAVLTWLGLES